MQVVESPYHLIDEYLGLKAIDGPQPHEFEEVLLVGLHGDIQPFVFPLISHKGAQYLYDEGILQHFYDLQLTCFVLLVLLYPFQCHQLSRTPQSSPVYFPESTSADLFLNLQFLFTKIMQLFYFTQILLIFLVHSLKNMQGLHFQGAVDFFGFGATLWTAKAVLIHAYLLEGLSGQMLGFAIPCGCDGEIHLWLGEYSLAYFMVSKLIEGEAVGVRLYLLGIFLIGGEEIMALLEVLDSIGLFQSANGAHLSKGFTFGIRFEGGPISLKSGLVDLQVTLLTATRFVIGAGGVIEEAGGFLAGECLCGGLFEEILFFHLFYNFYGMTTLTSKSYLFHANSTYPTHLFPIIPIITATSQTKIQISFENASPFMIILYPYLPISLVEKFMSGI